jgi:hypothetical protein
MTPVEPLDPDTLAEGERLLAAQSGFFMSDDWRKWACRNAPALLAVARDHARLTAALIAIRDDDLVDYPEVARAALAPDA